MSVANVTHTFICLVGCLHGYVLWLITADVSGSKLPFNLSIYTCLLLGCDWNTNVTNANANQRLTKKGFWPAVMVKGQKLLSAGPASRTGSRQHRASCWRWQWLCGCAVSILLKRVCQQALSAVSLTDLTCVCKIWWKSFMATPPHYWR